TILSGASLSISSNAVFNDPLTLISNDITFAELASESGQNTWSGPITLQGRNQSLNVSAGRLTISGNISGGLVDMQKIGPGEAVLSGSNTYLGDGTEIQAGILTAASDAAFPPPAQPDSFDAIIVFPGATLQLKNNITIASD